MPATSIVGGRARLPSPKARAELVSPPGRSPSPRISPSKKSPRPEKVGKISIVPPSVDKTTTPRSDERKSVKSPNSEGKARAVAQNLNGRKMDSMDTSKRSPQSFRRSLDTSKRSPQSFHRSDAGNHNTVPSPSYATISQGPETQGLPDTILGAIQDHEVCGLAQAAACLG